MLGKTRIPIEMSTNTTLLKDFEPRLYQETILATCVSANTLVILPTGMGKTAIAFMLAAQRLQQYPHSKIVMLAPTKPLAEQHLATMKKHLRLDEDAFTLFTGSVKPEKRKQLFLDKQIIVSTPQGLENDIISNNVSLKDVSLLIFDESHRAVGEYSYCFIAQQYEKKARFARILALTASPGSDADKIGEVCSNLHVEAVEIRTHKDPDVAPYVKPIKMRYEMVPMADELKSIHKYLTDCLKTKISEAKQYGYVSTGGYATVSKGELLKMQKALQAKVISGEKEMEIFKSISIVAEALKVEHALEMIETQGIVACNIYLEDLYKQSETTKVKAVQNLVKDINFRSALLKSRTLLEKNVEHPKMQAMRTKVTDYLTKNPDKKIMLFSHFRDTAAYITEQVNKLDNVRAKLFVGQAKKRGHGLSQKEQKEIIEQFRAGEYNVLVATSVAEEGLDIPNVDLVMFYEPVPSAIRSIQRRGRTGRHEDGQVIVFVTKGTREEGYRWAAHHKEKRMYRILDEMKTKLTHLLKKPQEDKTQSSLQEFVSTVESEITIFADYREKGSAVIKELIDGGVQLQLCTLDAGDFMISSRAGVEFKTVSDFVDSIVDGRLLDQLKYLKDHYERPMIIIQGSEDVYTQRNLHPNAIRGMYSTIMISYGIPILHTKNHRDTAAILAMIAKREQDPTNKAFNPHSMKKRITLAGKQEYVVGSIPGIGASLAPQLLEKFGSVRAIMNASIDELKTVDLIGPKKAEQLRSVLDAPYRK